MEAKPILIVVSTFNRRDLTGITLDSIKRNKSDLSDVVILDDVSTEYGTFWLSSWVDFKCYSRHMSEGVGPAARRRIEHFLFKTNYPYVLTLDNDLIFGKHFDRICMEAFVAFDDKKATVYSGYHSNTQVAISDCGPKDLIVKTINGCCQFMDRRTAHEVLHLMCDKWTHPWDANISQVLSKIIVPKRSLVQHLGIHGSGVNGMSTDVAVDFVGDPG